jgi:hypothetical protein
MTLVGKPDGFVAPFGPGNLSPERQKAGFAAELGSRYPFADRRIEGVLGCTD